MGIGLIAILAVVVAIVATVLAFVFIVPDKKREKLNKFGKFLHDTVNFKYLIIEKILQALYIFATAYVILVGFFMLFYVQEGYYSYYYSTPSRWYGGYGLLVMILGPILVRLAYEFLMMTILLIKNVIQINNKMKSGNTEKADVFAAPRKEAYATPAAPAAPAAPATPAAPVAAAAPAAPVAPEQGFCTNCGAKLADGAAFCTNCGTKN